MRAPLLALLLALPAAAGTEDEWVLTFDNGDLLHCRLEALDGDQLTVRWAVAPDEPVRLDVKAIAFLERASEVDAPTEPPADADILRLHDGGILYGRAVAVAPDGVEFEVPDIGRLRIAAAEILHLARSPGQIALPEQKEGEFAVALKSGATLAGRLDTDERGRLVLEGEGIRASIDYDSLAMLAYPRVTPAETEADTPAPTGAQIRLRSGSVLGGRQPELAEGVFRVTVGGRVAAAALSEIAAISFQAGGIPLGRMGHRSVFVWGRWSDEDDEYRKTVEILKKELDPRWTLVESTAEEYDDAFRRALFACGTMVIPEMEKLDRASRDAADLRPHLQAFVRSGGNVIICGVQAQHCDWVRLAGLFDLAVVGGVDGQPVKFTRKGETLGQGIDTFTAMNATFAYKVANPDALSLAETDAGSVVVARRIGRGWMICIGLDYYNTNEGASKLLAQAVQLR